MTRHRHTAETCALISARNRAAWAHPEKRHAQSAITKARMARPGISEKISTRTAEAMARPDVKERQRAGLKAAWADPAKREAQATLTRERMAKWRQACMEAARVVLAQLPSAQREVALRDLASAAAMAT